MGDPTGDLKGAAKEGKRIANLYSTAPKLGASVTKDLFLKSLKTNAIIHFAGHGKTAKSTNLQSLRIELGNGQMVTAKDLINERNVANLVVLGACVTGFQSLLGGEEKASIPYSLIVSGVASVMASKWTLDDEEGLIFFEAFYKALITGKSGLHAYWEAYQSLSESSSCHGLALYGLPKQEP